MRTCPVPRRAVVLKTIFEFSRQPGSRKAAKLTGSTAQHDQHARRKQSIYYCGGQIRRVNNNRYVCMCSAWAIRRRYLHKKDARRPPCSVSRNISVALDTVQPQSYRSVTEIILIPAIACRVCKVSDDGTQHTSRLDRLTD